MVSGEPIIYHYLGDFSWGGELVGEFKENKAWNVAEYDKDGNIIEMWVNGEMESIKI